MTKIITVLLLYIQTQAEIINYLLILLISKDFKVKPDKPVNKKYRKLQVDSMPIIEKLEKLDYKELLLKHKIEKGKILKPIKRQPIKRHKKSNISKSLTCPKCNAPHDYLYDNTGGRGQFKCKVCHCNFNHKNRFSKSVILRCPHCSRTLEKIKKRKKFNIYKCKNDNCSFYLSNLNHMIKEEKKLFKQKPHKFKVRYIYREFNFQPLSKENNYLPSVDILEFMLLNIH